MSLACTIEPRTEQRPFVVVHLFGEIDSVSAQDMDGVLDQLTEEKHCTIAVDLAEVDYVSSAGWGAFSAPRARTW